MENIRATSKLIFRNAAFNLVGRVAPLIVGVASLPYIISGLGIEQFGILSIVWASLLNYFSFFDFGLGQSITKFVAQFSDDQDRLSRFVWTSLIFAIALGIMGTLIVLLITPVLVNNVLNISSEFVDVVQRGFFILAFVIPLLTITSICRGILGGIQRYDIINYIKIPISSLIFLIPVFSIMFGFDLSIIILFLVITQLVRTIIYLSICSSIIRKFSWPKIKDGLMLFAFSKWLVLSSLLITFFAHINRFLIGAVLSATMIGFYTAPFDVIDKLTILPESLIVLFPLFSRFGSDYKKEAGFFYTRAIKHLLVVIGLISIVAIFFAADILLYWLGPEFKQNSTVVLQLLTVGIFAFSFSLLGENVIKGYGRVDILGKLRLIEIPFFAFAFWFFIKRFGLDGAAFIWMIWAIADALIITSVAFRLLSLRRSETDLNRTLFPLFLLGLAVFIGNLVSSGIVFVSFVVLLFIAFIPVWRYYILDGKDIRFFKSWIN